MQIKSSKKLPLLELLGLLAPDSSKNTLRSWVEKGRVLIDDQVAHRSNQTVQEGQQIKVVSKPKFLRNDLTIIYEDEYLVVIDKPAGLLSVAKDLDTEISAHSILKRRFNNRRVFPIHRLDKDTSGLLIFAYDETAYRDLKEQLEKRTLYREYRALVHGHPGKGIWRSFLREDNKLHVHSCPPAKGKEAITHFETIKKQKKCSLLCLRLETGRKHQIRVQASENGYPIVGDKRYGIEDGVSSFKLRAVAFSFVHPILKKELFFKGRLSLE